MTEELFLWQFHWDVGRSGDLHGLFVATEEQVKNAIGKQVDFGEVLGKHSEVYGYIEEGEITKVKASKSAIKEVSEVLGRTWSGYNPLNYIREKCDFCGSRSEETVKFDDGKIKCSECMTEKDWDVYYGRDVEWEEK